MKENKLHLVPQVIIDCVNGLMETRQDHLRMNYIIRLEAIRDYCDQAIKNNSTAVQPSFDRKPKSKYSRIGINNV